MLKHKRIISVLLLFMLIAALSSFAYADGITQYYIYKANDANITIYQGTGDNKTTITNPVPSGTVITVVSSSTGKAIQLIENGSTVLVEQYPPLVTESTDSTQTFTFTLPAMKDTSEKQLTIGTRDASAAQHNITVSDTNLTVNGGTLTAQAFTEVTVSLPADKVAGATIHIKNSNNDSPCTEFIPKGETSTFVMPDCDIDVSVTWSQETHYGVFVNGTEFTSLNSRIEIGTNGYATYDAENSTITLENAVVTKTTEFTVEGKTYDASIYCSDDGKFHKEKITIVVNSDSIISLSSSSISTNQYCGIYTGTQALEIKGKELAISLPENAISGLVSQKLKISNVRTIIQNEGNLSDFCGIETSELIISEGAMLIEKFGDKDRVHTINEITGIAINSTTVVADGINGVDNNGNLQIEIIGTGNLIGIDNAPIINNENSLIVKVENVDSDISASENPNNVFSVVTDKITSSGGFTASATSAKESNVSYGLYPYTTGNVIDIAVSQKKVQAIGTTSAIGPIASDATNPAAKATGTNNRVLLGTTIDHVSLSETKDIDDKYIVAGNTSNKVAEIRLASDITSDTSNNGDENDGTGNGTDAETEPNDNVETQDDTAVPVNPTPTPYIKLQNINLEKTGTETPSETVKIVTNLDNLAYAIFSEQAGDDHEKHVKITISSDLNMTVTGGEESTICPLHFKAIHRPSSTEAECTILYFDYSEKQLDLFKVSSDPVFSELSGFRQVEVGINTYEGHEDFYTNKIKWTSDNTAIATVNPKTDNKLYAFVRPVSNGTTTVRASIVDSKGNTRKSVAFTVTVNSTNSYKYTYPTTNNTMMWYYDQPTSIMFKTNIPASIISQHGVKLYYNSTYSYQVPAKYFTVSTDSATGYSEVVINGSWISSALPRKTLKYQLNTYFDSDKCITRPLYVRSIYDSPVTGDENMGTYYLLSIISGLLIAIAVTAYFVKRKVFDSKKPDKQ